MNEKIVAAVIGCGRIATNGHFPALKNLGNVRIKYACDLISEKAEAKKREYPGLVENAITDYRIALEDPETEVIFVLTPNFAHYTIAMEALSAGKHVFCEKPITVNYELSCKMAEKAHTTGKLLNIGVCNRYNRAVELLEEMNRRGKFGKIYHVYCSFRSYRCIPGLGGDFTNKKQSGGGVLIDWGVHFLDLVLYVLGGAKIRTVTCDAYSEMAKDISSYSYTSMWAEDTKNPNGVNDVEDFISGHIRTDKASVSFNGAWAQNIDQEEMFFDFLGDKGGARLSYGGHFTFYTTDESGVLQTVKPTFNIPNQIECEDRAFLQAVRENKKTKTYIDCILESAKLLDALYESAEKKAEIRF